MIHLKKTDTDVITNVNVKSWFRYTSYIYGETGFTVRGDAIKNKKN